MVWQAEVERKLGGEWEHMQDWGGKLTGATVRIAALLHAATTEHPAKTAISGEVMEAAVKIARVLSAHAEAAYQMMGASEAEKNAQYLWQKMKESGQMKFNGEGIYLLMKNTPKENRHAALTVLVERGYIRMAEERTGGRPRTVIRVNPLAADA